MFAIVQKEQLGLDKAIEEIKFRMSVRECPDAPTFLQYTMFLTTDSVFVFAAALQRHAQHDDHPAAARPLHVARAGDEADLPAGRSGGADRLRAGPAGLRGARLPRARRLHLDSGEFAPDSTPHSPVLPRTPLIPACSARSTRSPTTRTPCRCCSAPRRSASSTACRRRRSTTRTSSFRRATWVSLHL